MARRHMSRSELDNVTPITVSSILRVATITIGTTPRGWRSLRTAQGVRHNTTSNTYTITTGYSAGTASLWPVAHWRSRCCRTCHRQRCSTAPVTGGAGRSDHQLRRLRLHRPDRHDRQLHLELRRRRHHNHGDADHNPRVRQHLRPRIHRERHGRRTRLARRRPRHARSPSPAAWRPRPPTSRTTTPARSRSSTWPTTPS